jgi:putative phage-type endonuclease
MALDRGEWLEQRRKGIGGSDAAAILGLSKYRSAVDVWEDKLGLVEERPQTAAMAWGLRLEDAIASAYTETTGIRVRKVPGIRRAHHVRDYPMIASLDRRGEDGRVVELKKKRTDADLSEDGPPEKRVPSDWYVQIQHYLEVVEADVADVAILVGGTDFRVISLPRDPDFGRDLRAEEGAFWREYVLTETQPPVGPDDLAFLSRKYPISADEEKIAPAEISALVEAYLDTVDGIEELETRRDDYRAKLEDFLGTAARLVSSAGVVRWKSHERTSTSWKAYAESLEALVARIRLREADELRMGGRTPIDLDGLLSEAFGTIDLANVRSIYSATSTVRPFAVDRKKEA